METTTVRLYGTATWEEGAETIRGLMFEQMQKLAEPVVKHYYGDLYRTAIWVGTHVNGPTVVFFSFGESGVELNSMESQADAIWFLGRENRYRLDLRADYNQYSDGATWYLDINKLNDAEDVEAIKNVANS